MHGTGAQAALATAGVVQTRPAPVPQAFPSDLNAFVQMIPDLPSGVVEAVDC
jgi:hypothetical protein